MELEVGKEEGWVMGRELWSRLPGWTCPGCCYFKEQKAEEVENSKFKPNTLGCHKDIFARTEDRPYFKFLFYFVIFLR